MPTLPEKSVTLTGMGVTLPKMSVGKNRDVIFQRRSKMKKLLILLLTAVLLCGCARVQGKDVSPESTTEILDPSDPAVCKGRVMIDEKDVITNPDIAKPTDLSNIEIEVRYGRGSGMGSYTFSYDHSVYPDKDGYFAFKKPSEAYSLVLKFSSLPAGYGVQNPLISHIPNRDTEKDDNFIISAISRVEIGSTGVEGYISNIDMFDSQGNIVIAEYSVAKNADPLSYEELASLDELAYTVTVTASRVDVEKIDESLDLREKNVVEKINLLYALDLIDEEKKIMYYCSAWPENKSNVDCTTSLFDLIHEYNKAHADEELDPALKSAMDRVLNRN